MFSAKEVSREEAEAMVMTARLAAGWITQEELAAMNTVEEEAEVDIAAVQKEIETLEGELKVVQTQMDKYLKELNRGYEYLEDLFVPGYFEISIKKGQFI